MIKAYIQMCYLEKAYPCAESILRAAAKASELLEDILKKYS